MEAGISLAEAIKILIPLVGASGGAAWAGVKVALNGTGKRVERVERKLDEHAATVGTKFDRLEQSHAALHRDFVYLKGQLGAS